MIGMEVVQMKLGRMFLRLAAIVAALGMALASPVYAQSQAGADPARGELLYDTSCRTCHSTQPHWRDKRVAKSWPELVGQVERWRRVAGQNWSSSEVADVAAYLNDRFYHFICEGPGCQGPRSAAQ